jgi:hypothetical protein
MKQIAIVLGCLFITASAFSQTAMKPLTVGHPITINLPDYMTRTIGINDDAAIQFKNEVKDVYGFVIEDNKDELKMAEIAYSSITDFYDEFIKEFVKGEEKLQQSKPVSKKVGDVSFIEADVSFYSKEAEAEIYYLIGIVETKTAYYKVLCYTALANKAKFKADFQKIVYSLKD